MAENEKHIKGVMKRLGGLQQCMSELETTEADLMTALGMSREETGDTSVKGDFVDLEYFLYVLANAVEAREQHALGHIDRVMQLVLALGRKLAIPEEDMKALKLGGMLHDIGKLGIPARLIGHPGRLSAATFEPMKNHPEIGYHLCLPLKGFIGPALDMIRQHHEKLDGSGYPHGFQGEAICLGARIITVADIFDGLTTDRPYRKGISREEAVIELRDEAKTGRLDDTVVAAFAELF